MCACVAIFSLFFFFFFFLGGGGGGGGGVFLSFDGSETLIKINIIGFSCIRLIGFLFFSPGYSGLPIQPL